MPKILIVDDDEAIRRLVRINLLDLYQIFDTGQPEEALALALEHKPDAILLDLRMPGYSGFELCKTFTTFSATQLIPVFIISGEGGAKTKDFCRDLGATAYFEKPVNFDALRARLAEALKGRRTERRSEVRVALRVPLKLSGKAADGTSFSIPTTTENVSKSSFFCACAVVLLVDTIVEVFHACCRAGVRWQGAHRAHGVAADAVSALCAAVHRGHGNVDPAVSFQAMSDCRGWWSAYLSSSFAYLTGTARFDPPKSLSTAKFMPITFPSRLKSGPPEPPEVVAAS